MTDNELKILMEQKEQLEKAIEVLKRLLNLSIETEFDYDDNGERDFVGFQLHYGNNGEWKYLKTSEGDLLRKVLWEIMMKGD